MRRRGSGSGIFNLCTTICGTATCRPRPFAETHRHDDKITKNRARRVGRKGQPFHVTIQTVEQIHPSLVAKGLDQFPRRRIERVEKTARRKHQPALAIFLPPRKSAVQPAPAFDVPRRKRIEAPEFAPRRGLDRKEHEHRRRAVEHAVDHKRVALNLRTVVRIGSTGAKRPRGLQPRDIGRRNLRERRVVRATRVAKIDGPIGIGCDDRRTGPSHQHRKQSRTASERMQDHRANHGKKRSTEFLRDGLLYLREFRFERRL